MLAVTFACTAVQANLVPPAGEGNRGQTQYWLAKREKNEAGSLKRPQVNSFLVQDTYHCSYGPEDFRGCLPEALTQKDRPANSRVTKKDRGQSCKRGCLQQFTISKLYDYSEVAQLSMKHSEHTDKASNVAHGSSLAAQGIRELHAPHVSDKMRDWVTIKVNDRCTTQQILKQHAKAVEARIADGNSDRDCFLTGQDIRNIEQKLAKGTWKLHENHLRRSNSVVRKRTIGLDGFPKAKRKVAQPTPASQPVQAEAAPFTKPQPARKKAGPRQQARVASALTGQENSSAAANQQQQQQPASAAAANKPSSAPKSQHMRRCGSCANCLRPQAKKVCLTNQALRAQLAAQP